MCLSEKGSPLLFPPKGYIIGAPKCGTTALAHYLANHPQVAFSKPKEPHFYSDDLVGLRWTDVQEKYKSFFSPTVHTRITMEASVWYLYSQTAVRAIMQARPDARLIVMLRDPVRMLPSLHRQLVNAFDEDERDFETAWRLSDLRERGERIPPKCRAPMTLFYKRTAEFGEMLERLWTIVPREQVLVLFQEEMEADTGTVYRQALDFLGLDDDGRQTFPKVNEAKRQRSRALGYVIGRWGPIREMASRPLKKSLGVSSLGITKRLQKANAVATGVAPLSPALAQEISRHYAEDIGRLAQVLDHRLPPEFGLHAQPKQEMLNT